MSTRGASAEDVSPAAGATVERVLPAPAGAGAGTDRRAARGEPAVRSSAGGVPAWLVLLFVIAFTANMLAG